MSQRVEIRLKIDTDDGVTGGLEAELVVDGETLPVHDHGPLDLAELERSIQGDGTYFPWTCWCGVAGCAGRLKGVVVRHRGDEMKWQDRDMKRAYSFRTYEVRHSLAHALTEGRRMLSMRPELEIIPDQNRECFSSHH